MLRSLTTWSLAHGIQRTALRRAAAQGDLAALLTMDPVVSANPFSTYERIRARGRVVRGPMISATADHAVGSEVLRSDHWGTAAGHSELPPPLRKLIVKVADPYGLSPVDPPSLLAVDPPDHTRHRKLVARAFTARRIADLQSRVEKVSAELLDDLAPDTRGGFDLVDRYAARLPVAVIAELLGVPAADHERLLAWGNRAAITLDPGLSFRQYRDAEAALRQMHHWFDGHVERLRKDPGDDLLSQLVQLDEADALTPLELRAIGLLILGAGFETTVNLIGNAMVQLAAHPDQRALLVAEPERWGNAVEEVLRFDSPVQLTLRAALRDTEIGGTSIGKDEGILVLIGGVNRDPAVFTDPQRFDVTRENAAQHLAFSAGIHFCLGASLARLEAEVALRQLHERYPNLRMVGTPVRRATRVLRGYEHVPVRTVG